MARTTPAKIAPLTAAEAAQALGVKVYTIGVGMRGEAPMPVGRNPFTGETMLPDRCRWILTKTRCSKIANRTGGKYYRADNTRTVSGDLRRDRQAGEDGERGEEIRPAPGAVRLAITPGLGLVLLEVLLRHTIWRRLP